MIADHCLKHKEQILYQVRCNFSYIAWETDGVYHVLPQVQHFCKICKLYYHNISLLDTEYILFRYKLHMIPLLQSWNGDFSSGKQNFPKYIFCSPIFLKNSKS